MREAGGLLACANAEGILQSDVISRPFFLTLLTPMTLYRIVLARAASLVLLGMLAGCDGDPVGHAASPVVALSVGGATACALREDGSLWCRGYLFGDSARPAAAVQAMAGHRFQQV